MRIALHSEDGLEESQGITINKYSLGEKYSPNFRNGKGHWQEAPHIKNEQGWSHSDLPWDLRSYAPRGHLQAPWEVLGPKAWVQATLSSGEILSGSEPWAFLFKNAD